MLNFKNTYFEDHLRATAPNTLRRVIEPPSQVFCILINDYEFFKFFPLGNVPWQCIMSNAS